MIVTPTIHFNGDCEKAIKLYEQAFKAKIGCLLRYADANENDWDTVSMTEEEKNYIYHAEITIGDQRIMMSDELVNSKQGSVSIFLTITFPTDAEVKEAYNLLALEGTPFYPLRRTTYSSCMGTVIDKFGYRWGLMTEHTQD